MIVKINIGEGQGREVEVNIQGQEAEKKEEAQGHTTLIQGHLGGQGHIHQIERVEKINPQKEKTHVQIFQDFLT